MTPQTLGRPGKQRHRAPRLRARLQALGRGNRAETIAAWWLRLKGYRVLARGYRSPAGEIDLIAKRGRTLAIVEVKARPSLAQASDALSPRQRKRIARAAEAFVQRHPSLAGCAIRFDIVMVVPSHWPRHIAGAWRPG